MEISYFLVILYFGKVLPEALSGRRNDRLLKFKPTQAVEVDQFIYDDYDDFDEYQEDMSEDEYYSLLDKPDLESFVKSINEMNRSTSTKDLAINRSHLAPNIKILANNTGTHFDSKLKEIQKNYKTLKSKRTEKKLDMNNYSLNWVSSYAKVQSHTNKNVMRGSTKNFSEKKANTSDKTFSKSANFGSKRLTAREKYAISQSSEQDVWSEAAITSRGLYLENPREFNCKPMMMPVELGLNYYPMCVELMQCSGCCRLKERMCKATVVTSVTVRVVDIRRIKRQVSRGSKFDEKRTKSNARDGKVSSVFRSARMMRKSRRRPGRPRRHPIANKYLNITVFEHNSCKCMCKNDASSCDEDLHDFDELFCLCKCKNKFAKDNENCYQSEIHYWDDIACQCKCRLKVTCTTGTLFDHKTCGCEQPKRTADRLKQILSGVKSIQSQIKRIFK